MGTEIIRAIDAPRFFITVLSDPKREGIPATRGHLDIGARQANALIDDSSEYAKRVGWVIAPYCRQNDRAWLRTPRKRAPRKAKRAVLSDA